MIELAISKDLPENWPASLTMLYRPLIGPDACSLYALLLSLGQQTGACEKADIEGLLQMTPGHLKEARIQLEEFELLRTFVNEREEIVRLQLLAVLSPAAFLNHEIYRRILFQAIGEEGMECIKHLLLPAEPEEESLKEITSSLRADRLASDWSDDQESRLACSLSDLHDPQKYDFDWGVFYLGMQNAIPQRLRSRQNMTRIARLANVYGIGEEDMRKIVIKHLRDRRTWIDFDAMAAELNTTKRIESVDPGDYSQPPVAFLKARQPKNADILPKERSLLLYLSERHQFSNELINTIVEYSMEQCQGALIDKYVRTLSNNMSRAGIESRDQALEYFTRSKKEKTERSKTSKIELPDWYDNVPDPNDKGTPEELEEILRMQQQILQPAQTGQKS